MYTYIYFLNHYFNAVCGSQDTTRTRSLHYIIEAHRRRDSSELLKFDTYYYSSQDLTVSMDISENQARCGIRRRREGNKLLLNTCACLKLRTRGSYTREGLRPFECADDQIVYPSLRVLSSKSRMVKIRSRIIRPTRASPHRADARTTVRVISFKNLVRRVQF